VEQTSYMFVTGPNVLKTVTHEDVTFEQLGGAMVHNSTSGVAHFSCPSEPDCIRMIRQLMSFIPSNNLEDPPRVVPIDTPTRAEEALNTIIPDNPNKPYDMKAVIKDIVDDGDFFEVQEYFAKNIIVGFARLNGRSIGIVAQQPHSLAGVLDIDSADKGARFVRFCDCFNIPIITFVDVPGFLPGVSQEHNGIIRHGAKLLYAYCEATVPKITVITRKAYGGAYDVMNSKHVRGDINYAWPTAEIAVMGAEGAVNILFKDEIDSAEDPEQKRKELIAEYTDKFANPYIAAGRGYVDEVIEPRYTRAKLITALEMLKNKRDTNPPKKHGNIPL
jgi:acetyl-CoA carboxylase carboxyltransferase component